MMLLFQEMIKNLRDKKSIIAGPGFENDFIKNIYEAEIFVLNQDTVIEHFNKEPEPLPILANETILALPFRVTSFEVNTGIAFISIPGFLKEKNERIKGLLDSVFIIENHPGNYTFLVQGVLDNMDDDSYRFCLQVENDDKQYDTLLALVYELIYLINNNKQGVEKVKKYLKINKREKRKINRIIHVSSKKYINDSYKSIQGRKIDWLHSWLVRGHWRRIKGIGKDRDGNYIIKGMTFVSEHKKGKGELVHKTRVYA